LGSGTKIHCDFSIRRLVFFLLPRNIKTGKDDNHKIDNLGSFVSLRPNLRDIAAGFS